MSRLDLRLLPDDVKQIELGPRVRYYGGKTSSLYWARGNIVGYRDGRTNVLVRFDFDPEHPKWVYEAKLGYITERKDAGDQ